MGQSLWKTTSTSLVSDKKAHSVGDILMIIIEENNSASKNNSLSTEKKNSIDASLSTFLYSNQAMLSHKGTMPAMKLSGTSDSAGSGKISNTETISDKVTVHVTDVLPNGNMIVEGTRQTSFSGESQQAVLHGVVRPEDVSCSNTVYSYNLSDATIKFISKGVVTDAQRKNWFMRVYDKVAPF
jgi:flagellar L-ring protein precursor FlgH